MAERKVASIKAAAKKQSVSREVRLSDLDGIKKALMFFIERERDIEMSKELSRSLHGMHPNNDSRLEHREKTKREVNKKYDALTKGLK
jgi:hypothetical protein